MIYSSSIPFKVDSSDYKWDNLAKYFEENKTKIYLLHESIKYTSDFKIPSLSISSKQIFMPFISIARSNSRKASEGNIIAICVFILSDQTNCRSANLKYIQ